MNKRHLEQYDDGNPGTLLDEGLSQAQLKELFSLIGSLLAKFNHLESLLEKLIVEAINSRSHQPGYAVVAGLSSVFTKKVSVFKALYGPFVESSNNEKLKAIFPKLVKKLFQIKDIRNKIAHANWLDASSKYEVRLSIDSDELGAYTKTEEITPAQLKDNMEKLKDVEGLLEEFGELIF